MSEVFELVEIGVLCQVCGSYVGEVTNFPRSCEDCEEGEE